MKTLLLIRGAPGSGKSTIAIALVTSGVFDVAFEADDFFEKSGMYKFIPEDIPKAHSECQKGVENAMLYDANIVVSNTFTQEWQIAPYRSLALKYGYKVQEMVLLYPVFKNIHGVPQDKVDAMQNRLLQDIKESI